MNQRDRRHNFAEYLERFVFDADELQLRQKPRRHVVATRLKRIAENRTDDLFDALVAIDRQRPTERLREHANVVEAVQVIDVVVRVKHRMNERNLLAQKLHPQLRRGIDE